LCIVHTNWYAVCSSVWNCLGLQLHSVMLNSCNFRHAASFAYAHWYRVLLAMVTVVISLYYRVCKSVVATLLNLNIVECLEWGCILLKKVHKHLSEWRCNSQSVACVISWFSWADLLRVNFKFEQVRCKRLCLWLSIAYLLYGVESFLRSYPVFS
jgi:hypothetical protein